MRRRIPDYRTRAKITRRVQYTVYMGGITETCGHPAGLRVLANARYRCPACESELDLREIEDWVRKAEMIRDEAHPTSGNGIWAAEEQREVYRRRKVLYELQETSRTVEARPEMVLVLYESLSDHYECNIFYKEPKPASVLDYLCIGADWERILGLCSRPDPNVRLVADKIREFHGLRLEALKRGEEPSRRRVFYSNEL